MSELTCSGLWWIPEVSGEKVAGTLTFSEQNGVELSLGGTLGHSVPPWADKVVPIVLGLVHDSSLGDHFTVQSCRLANINWGSDRPPRETYSSERLYIGKHLEKNEDFLFRTMAISFSGLSSWAYTFTGLQRTASRIPGHGPPDLQISWKCPTPIAGLLPGARLSLQVSAQLEAPLRIHTLKEAIQFVVDCDDPATVEDWNRRYVLPLQGLLTLASDHPNSVTELSLRHDGISGQEQVRVFEPRVVENEKAVARLMPYQMLFSLADIQPGLAQLVTKWLEVWEHYKDACEPFFGVVYRPNAFTELRYLLAYQAIEVYYSLRRGTPPEVSDDIHRGQHLRELLDEHWREVGALFGQMDQTLPELVAMRNYVVHRQPSRAGGDLGGQALYLAAERLLFLMKACLLTELGFSTEQRQHFFTQNASFQALAKHSTA